MPDSQPQRIAFALPHLKAGGIEVVVRALLTHLDRSRWSPLLILNRCEGELLRDLPQDVLVAGCGGKGLLPRAWALARLLRQHRVKLLYSGTNAMNLSAALAVSMMPRRQRPRLVLSEHTTVENYLAKARRPRLRRGLIRLLYPRADRLAVPLQAIGEGWLKALALPGPPLACLPNPVLEDAELAELQADPPERLPGRIAAAGRLIKDKGHDVLIRAFAEVLEMHPQAELLIYGSGPERAALEQLALRLGAAERVRLMGYSGNLLHDFARAELAVLPSLREGFGNVAVEALAAGTPLIASRCLGPEAILQGGRHGVLVEPGNVQMLAAAIRRALSRPVDPQFLEEARKAADPYLAATAVRAFENLASGLLVPAAAAPEPGRSATARGR
ncbi:glycosyltransferase [Leisingera sp. ANG-Vp]|uniref:glycosyltransferase n=1 Tax=Leisingera sp. ANG-Vp TaxID=1577896 RepID=UPI000689EF36|nr:glycosyltransferase [Leisingera sp. ANG-Vp]